MTHSGAKIATLTVLVFFPKSFLPEKLTLYLVLCTPERHMGKWRKWEWVASFAPFVLTPGNLRSLFSTYGTGEWLAPRAGLDIWAKREVSCFAWEMNHDSWVFHSLACHFISTGNINVQTTFIHTHSCKKPKNANRRYMFHHILLRFTNMFRLFLRPSSSWHNRIKNAQTTAQKSN
jgi:hypothetical protein